jgi:hypothetical protein
MRYIILNKYMTKEEMVSRKKFIEKVTNLYFIPFVIEGGIELKSIPSSTNDSLMIVGHNLSVNNYIKNNVIKERNIIIISCKFDIEKRFRKEKNIYVSYNDEGITNYYDGTDRNLHFYVSKEELKLINSSGPFIERVKKIFRRIS